MGAEMVAEGGSYGYVGTTSPLLITGDSSGEASGGPGAAQEGRAARATDRAKAGGSVGRMAISGQGWLR